MFQYIVFIYTMSIISVDSKGSYRQTLSAFVLTYLLIEATYLSQVACMTNRLHIDMIMKFFVRILENNERTRQAKLRFYIKSRR